MTCRYCRKGDEHGPLIHYAVRHYAHTPCLVKARGEEFILSLPVGALNQVAVFQISDAARERLIAKCGAGR